MTKNKTALFEGDMYLSEQIKAYEANQKKGYDGTFKQFQNDLDNGRRLPINPRRFKS